MGAVFAHLMAFPKYAAIFDREKDRQTVQAHMDRHSLKVADMERICWEMRQWADGPNAAAIKSPRGVLSTFVQGFLKRRAEQPKPKPEIPVLTEADLEQLGD